MDDLLQLQQPLKDGGIRSVNFFNGRLLAGKDLSREQAARRESDWRLGLALGNGVAFGFKVDEDSQSTSNVPIVRVQAGLAVNRLGQALRLTDNIRLALARQFDAVSANCLFGDCTPLSGGTYLAGDGLYLLTVAPAESSEGRAATNGLDPANVRCNTDTTVEAVQFRLLAINRSHYSDLDQSSQQFRNRIAYRCFGIEAREKSVANPWVDDPITYGLVDALRQKGLDDRDVPLALIFWTAAGVQFIDMWAVRRALLAPDNLSASSFVARRRRLVETDAMCAQFQQQLADLLAASAQPDKVIAVEHFRYLPPFGMLPLQSLPLRGFSEASFFSGLIRRPTPGANQPTEFIDARLLGTLRHQASAYPPTDVTAKEFIWVFRAWQNVRAIASGTAAQPMTVFACGYMPNPAIARFDMARFDYSNYANCCSGS